MTCERSELFKYTQRVPTSLIIERKHWCVEPQSQTKMTTASLENLELEKSVREQQHRYLHHTLTLADVSIDRTWCHHLAGIYSKSPGDNEHSILGGESWKNSGYLCLISLWTSSSTSKSSGLTGLVLFCCPSCPA
mmetsp:Transcript_27414/g.45338  ORF Transcript_27414/g.45338 Transcript_27414/m.45338 type:complete len:135 (-) Transcript_27414:94-498(-)